MLGLGKIGVIFIVVTASLAAAGVAYKYWERSVVESAGAKASVEAFEERERFESEQAAIAMQELETLKARMSEIEQGFDSFEQLQQMDWAPFISRIRLREPRRLTLIVYPAWIRVLATGHRSWSLVLPCNRSLGQISRLYAV